MATARNVARGARLGLIAGVVLLSSGCAPGVGGWFGRRTPAIIDDVVATRLPAVPLVRVSEASGLVLDGHLGEAGWATTREYTRFGLDSGLGLLDFPTSLRLLRTGRWLWVGLDCRIPNGKDGLAVPDAIDAESLEIWLDNAYTRHTFHHITLGLDGRANAPGIAPAVMAEAVQAKFRRTGAGYVAEMRIDLDRFDHLGRPNAERVGFNLARGGKGRWGSLVGIIGQAHKPDQFWALDLTGLAAERLPDRAYRDPFKPGTDVRELAQLLLEEWRSTHPSVAAPGEALMRVQARRLERLLEADATDRWGMERQLAVAVWRAMEAWDTVDPTAEPPALIRAMRHQLHEYGPDQGPYRKTPWREAAYTSSADDSAQPYTLYVPGNYDERRAYPLMVYMHGSGNTHFGAGAVFERYSADDDRYLKVRVCARKAGWYGPLAVRDVFDVIDDIRSRYNVDEDRIYLYGYSAGGYATFNIAARWPDRFAAAASLAGAGLGGNEQNLLNIPVLVYHGLADPIVPYYRDTGTNVAKLRAAGARVTVQALPAIGHGCPLTGVEDWLLQWRRTPAPTRVICKTDAHNPQPMQAYWISMLGLYFPHQQAIVIANVADGCVTITTGNVSAFAIDFGLLRRAGMRTATLTVDGQTVAVPATDYGYLRRNATNWQSDAWTVMPQPDPTQYRAGGADNLYAEGALMVVAPEAMLAFAEDMAQRGPYGRSPFVSLPVKRDIDVTDDDLARCNLILVGGPARNAVSARLVGQEWPLPITDGRITLGGQAYDLDRHAVSIVARNPVAPARRVHMIASNNDAAFTSTSALLKRNFHRGISRDIVVIDVAENAVKAAWLLGPDFKPLRYGLARW